MKLMDNLRHYAVQAMGAAIALQTAAAMLQAEWIKLPDSLKASVPHEWVSVATIAILVLGAVGHVWQGLQKPPPESKP